MARPLRKGPPLSFRVPLEHHEYLERKAAEKGQTVVEYVQAYLSRAIEAALAKEAK